MPLDGTHTNRRPAHSSPCHSICNSQDRAHDFETDPTIAPSALPRYMSDLYNFPIPKAIKGLEPR